ncbi:MAG TPA: hypothetical protein VIV27_01410 [Halioglobus sp.]
MARVIFSPELQRYTDGTREIEVSASRYQNLILELRQHFPALTDAVIEKHALAIDGMLIHTPLLETFNSDSELVFITKIAGG